MDDIYIFRIIYLYIGVKNGALELKKKALANTQA